MFIWDKVGATWSETRSARDRAGSPSGLSLRSTMNRSKSSALKSLTTTSGPVRLARSACPTWLDPNALWTATRVSGGGSTRALSVHTLRLLFPCRTMSSDSLKSRSATCPSDRPRQEWGFRLYGMGRCPFNRPGAHKALITASMPTCMQDLWLDLHEPGERRKRPPGVIVEDSGPSPRPQQAEPPRYGSSTLCPGDQADLIDPVPVEM